jgi:alpha-ketoglutarate-dependent taurine dioxygenase
VELPVFDYDDVLDHKSPANLRLLKDLMRYGAAIIDGCADPGEPALHRFADTCMGGLQKDPTRPESNWKIVKREGATSVSYDHLKRLNQHTDSSIPPHGVPALGLVLHYAEGFGTNTLTDGFAVAAALKEEDPEGYELLATYGYDGERDFVASRVDSVQEFNRGLVVSTQTPILQLDEEGELKRIQYNEVFRMPLSLPYEVFPRWYAAFSRFVELLHSGEYERKVPMEKGRFLVLHNWRVLHGRASGAASSNRVLVGGTVTREAFYSTARRLTREARGAFTDQAQEEELVLRQGVMLRKGDTLKADNEKNSET